MSRPRTTAPLRLALGALAVLVVAGALIAIARRPEVRLTVDATKTRSYSLSPQTRELLGRLEGDWRIAVVLAGEDVDARIRRQVDEVLRRFRAASDALTVTFVDPADPASLAAYEALLARLQAMERSAIDRYETRLDAAADAFDELMLYAQQVTVDLEGALRRLPEDDPGREAVTARLGVMRVLARDGGRLVDEIESARRPGDAVPLPRYDLARSILREACSQWADQVLALAALFDDWGRASGLPAELRLYGRQAAGPARELATRLVTASEGLVDLPDLQTARVAARLEEGEAAVVLGPDRAAVIPSEELLPRLPLDAGAGSATFDRRFQGEQVISAAIRSLLVDAMPTAVFVHVDPASMLAPRQDATDVAGLRAALERSRIEVREWAVDREERPVIEPGQPVTWFVVPPLRRDGLELDDRERALLEATRGLLAAGESVVLSLNPSLRPRMRMREPWAAVAEDAGVPADVGEVVLEATPMTAGAFSVEAVLALDAFPPAHPLARALEGQRLTLPLPVPLRAGGAGGAGDDGDADDDDDGDASGDGEGPAAGATTGATHAVVAAAEPQPGRWREDEWGAGGLPSAPPPGESLEAPVPLVVAVERPHPAGPGAGLPGLTGRQRLLVVGSGGWMRSRTADAIADLGGGRAALVSPGNQELALASVAWLAGQDELVVASAAGGQVARLRGVDGTVRTRWAIATVLVLPAALVVLGLAAGWWRRRAT